MLVTMLEYLDNEAQALLLRATEAEDYHGLEDARTWLLRHAVRRLEIHNKGALGSNRDLSGYELHMIDYRLRNRRCITFNLLYHNIISWKVKTLPTGLYKADRPKHNTLGVVWYRDRYASWFRERVELRSTGEIYYYEATDVFPRCAPRIAPHSDFIEATANDDLIVGRRRGGEVWWTSTSEWKWKPLRYSLHPWPVKK